EALQHGGFDVALVDLADFNLPVYDKPHHPRLKRYEHDHTKRWSASVAAADAFVFVMPEYNFGPTPALTNAIDYLFHEWA
ncbi:NAD(P)H-dependent oxidoreductase, partial [Mycobacterium tuberculosis]|nr:NAD(P)H-dependent oxidoreductase [Mycobacterium tuberculosis]